MNAPEKTLAERQAEPNPKKYHQQFPDAYPTISAYGHVFNATRMDYNIEKVLANFCTFFDEVVIATPKSVDDTQDRLKALQSKHWNLNVVESFDIEVGGSNNLWDGQLKTRAMNRCTSPIRVIVDMDEMIVDTPSQRLAWRRAAQMLLHPNLANVDGFLLPVVDLYGSKETIRADQQIGIKFRMHKDTVVERGVPWWAKTDAIHWDASKADGTEPITENGELAKFAPLAPPTAYNPFNTAYLNTHCPFVVHMGYLDLSLKVRRGKEFWADRWNEYSGKKENVATNVKELDDKPLVEHNIYLGDYFD